jgi:hypothetical protein
MENNNDYKESLKKEIEELESSPVQYDAEYVQETEAPEPKLGRVTSHIRDKEEELKEVNERIGYINLLMTNLPSKGRFYRNDMRISIRAARVLEIREFSTMDENSILDVDEKLNSILNSCCRIEYGGRRGSHKDILEEDRLFIILSIRELTFATGENRLMINAKCNNCKNDNSYELRTNILQYYNTDEYDKYYDEEYRAFKFETKSSGTIVMAPPTIGVMRTVTEYIKEKEEKKENWDKSFLQLLPYLQRDWRGFDKNGIFNANVEFNGWSANKYSTVYRLAEKIRVGVKQELTCQCGNCDGEVTVPITFPGGIKGLFVISDLSGELL